MRKSGEIILSQAILTTLWETILYRPIHYIYGNSDLLLEDQIEQILRKIKPDYLHLMKGGHFPMLENSSLFFKILNNILST